MSDTLYVNKPGGVIVHLDDGTSANLLYGQEVPSNLADHVNAGTFADGKQRLGSEAYVGQVADSHSRTALTEAGQVNSGSSPVPANYNELDEDTKVRFIEQLARYPEAQAKVLIHEKLFGGNSERVEDAASEAARISASLQLAQDANALADFTDHTQSEPLPGPGDPDVSPGDDNVTAAIQQRALATAKLAKSGDPTTPPPSGLSNPTPTGPGDSLVNLDSNQLQELAAREGVKLGNLTDLAKIVAKIEAHRRGE